MAVTTTLQRRTKLGNARMNVVDIALNTEQYATGGIPITAAKLGLGGIFAVLPAPAGGYIFEYDHANFKLKAYTPVKAQAAHTHTFTGDAMSITPTELTGEPTTKLLQNDAGVLKSTDTTAIPLGTPAGTNATAGAIAASAAAEVGNGVSLTATVRCIAIGI